MFVSLDRLKPMEDHKNPQEPHQPQPPHDERKHRMVIRLRVNDKQQNPNQQVQRTRSPKPYHPQFILNDRVLQNMTDRYHYEPISGECKLPAHPLNQQPNAQHSSGEQKKKKHYRGILNVHISH